MVYCRLLSMACSVSSDGLANLREPPFASLPRCDCLCCAGRTRERGTDDRSLAPPRRHTRMSELKDRFKLRVVLCHVDIKDSTQALLSVTSLTIANDWTLMLTWSLQEAARYVETYKSFENKSAPVRSEHGRALRESERLTLCDRVGAKDKRTKKRKVPCETPRAKGAVRNTKSKRCREKHTLPEH